MKQRITSILCLVVGTSMHAQGYDKPFADECEQNSDLAEQVMQNRQLGSTRDSLLEQLDQTPVTRQLVEMAFERPRYHTLVMQKRAQRDFALRYYRHCIQHPNT